MSEDKRTFIDTDTWEEVESSWLARRSSGLLFGLLYGLSLGFVVGLIIGPIFGLVIGLIFGLVDGLIAALLGGVVAGVALGLCGALIGVLVAVLIGGVMPPEVVRSTRYTRWVHDGIVRRQRRRHQRILRSQEHQDVPDTAISRAQPPGEPAPTDAALYMADEPEETEHLTVEVSEDTVETTVERIP